MHGLETSVAVTLESWIKGYLRKHFMCCSLFDKDELSVLVYKSVMADKDLFGVPAYLLWL